MNYFPPSSWGKAAHPGLGSLVLRRRLCFLHMSLVLFFTNCPLLLGDVMAVVALRQREHETLFLLLTSPLARGPELLLGLFLLEYPLSCELLQDKDCVFLMSVSSK